MRRLDCGVRAVPAAVASRGGIAKWAVIGL